MCSKVIVCISLCVRLIIAQDVGDPCEPNNNFAEGKCTMFTDCEPAIRQLKEKFNHDFKRCGFEGRIEVVCCPQAESRYGSTEKSLVNSQRTADRECQKILDSPFYALESYITGGKAASLGEFPHMVALGYDRGAGYQFSCGGSVISKDYILTAAHCVDTRDSIEPSVVRTGVVDLGGNTWDEENDVGIAEIIKHLDHTRVLNYHDIALLRLNKSLTFSDKLNAACLETSEADPTTPLIITGWGKISNINYSVDITTLQQASVSVVPIGKCGQSYTRWRKLPRGIVDNQLCAGEGTADTCQGDSGGPLQLSISEIVSVYKVVGITSFGSSCGSKAPGVYTRVAKYVDWIESIVWPQ